MVKKALTTINLRAMTAADLQKQLTSCKEEMVEKQRSLKAGELANPHSITDLRKTIARINTILSEQAAKNQEEK